MNAKKSGAGKIAIDLESFPKNGRKQLQFQKKDKVHSHPPTTKEIHSQRTVISVLKKHLLRKCKLSATSDSFAKEKEILRCVIYFWLNVQQNCVRSAIINKNRTS